MLHANCQFSRKSLSPNHKEERHGYKNKEESEKGGNE
jgi:hypothetical protein